MALVVQFSILAVSIYLVKLVFNLLVSVYFTTVRPRYILHRQGLPSTHSPPNAGSGRLHIPAREDPGVAHLRWREQCGPTFQLGDSIHTASVMSFDKTLLSHICNDIDVFRKPESMRKLLIRVLGEGLAVAEASAHSRQRKIMNPSFGSAQIKAMYSMIVKKAVKLSSVISNKIQDGPANIDMYHMVNNIALDIIGITGLGYEINAIEGGHKNELVEAFHALFRAIPKPSAFDFIARRFPFLAFTATRSKRERTTAAQSAKQTMQQVASKLLKEKRAAIHDGNEVKDLLSLLVKANMSQDLKPSARMTEEEVIAQIATFLFAGSDTTGSGLSWALHGLCKNPSAQVTLRAELANATLSLSSGAFPTYDEINSLDYLDAVVRETLRLYSPAHATVRVATMDTIIPLGEPYVDSKGVTHDRLQIAKNTMIMIPILAMNKSPSTWGPDAEEFRPERWLDVEEERVRLPNGSLELPSINFPTFLAGPRGCIGFRLSLIEMKVVLYTLIHSFKFEFIAGDEGLDDIEPVVTFATKPCVRSKRGEGPQLPLRVSVVKD